MQSSRIQFKGKSAIMKELQRTIAFRCYNHVVLTSGNCKGTKKLQAKVHELYFGRSNNDDDNIGFSYQQCMDGTMAFASLYDRTQQDVARGTTTTLSLKQYLHCTQETIIVSTNAKDQGINAAVLCSKGISNRAILTARRIWDLINQVEQNWKKALAIVQMSDYKDGNLPSGKTYEDYLLFVREAMYKEAKTKEQVDIDDDDDDDYDEEEEQSAAGEIDGDSAADMPENWIFPGYMAFALYGPIMPPGSDFKFKAEAFFATGDRKGKGKKDGRAVARMVPPSEDSVVTRSSASVTEGRGCTINEALFAASIAQQSHAATMLYQSKLIDRHINYHNYRIKRAERDVVERWRQLLTVNPDMPLNPDPNNLALEEFNKAKLRLGQVENEYQQYMDSISIRVAPENRYQRIVYTMLKKFMPPQDEPQPKRARCSTPMSSIYIPVGNDITGNNVDDDEEGTANHFTNSPPNRNT
ncbi:hypothetical protein IV203_000455 [Nitzschia inconspicua]|uniref:Uncharacterized protein n=1 Tax=Nitzschia inconspicua TaxID=303405 RepID=A0A9K3PSK2_9STRA|nr:hypothetical protein IV203_000455 [Nitzschia inconspicua]